MPDQIPPKSSAENQNAAKRSAENWLTWLILTGLILGAVVGQFLFWSYEAEPTGVPAGVLDVFNFVGNTFFMNLLKMILIPLVASSVIVGVASIGDPTQLGKVGGYAILYYFATMAIAVILGVILVSAIAPGDPNRDGKGIGQEVIAKGTQSYEAENAETRARISSHAKAGETGVLGALWASFKNIAEQMIPSNPIGAAADSQILPVIAFSLLLGIVITFVGPPAKPLLDVFDALYQVVMKMVEWILWLAPLGVFCLVVHTVANIGLKNLLGPMTYYVITVIVGLSIHALLILPLVLWFFTRSNPFLYMHQMRRALMTAFGTDSSSATLPVTIECAVEEGGCSKKTAGFVLPLGATINMDGTALYEAVAVVFLFQCYGIELSATALAIIVVTATLAAVGAAGIPSAGLVTMVIVVEAVNNSLPPEVPRLPLAAVGIILGIDRILDMCRTTVNVWGDAVGAKILTRLDPDADAKPT